MATLANMAIGLAISTTLMSLATIFHLLASLDLVTGVFLVLIALTITSTMSTVAAGILPVLSVVSFLGAFEYYGYEC